MRHGITGALDAIRMNTSPDEMISVGDIVAALNTRGYGALLIGLAVIIILPTGAIPGVPAAIALMIVFISAQILLGHHQPWMPRRLKDIKFSREQFMHGLDKATPYTRKIDALFYPRLEYLIKSELHRLIAILCIILACSIIILGWIPFLAMVPATAILLMGMALSARDGLLALLSLMFTLGGFVMLSSTFTKVFAGIVGG